MDALVERCCGLDVHQATVVACLIMGRPGERAKKLVRTFSTETSKLLELSDWLSEHGCTHVAMESTGVYWKPVYAVLEGAFELVVGNARHIRNVPGRKTDVKDAEWIADLLRHGLIAKSFVPPKPIRELRDLVRYRRTLVADRVTARNRILKLLETANIKLSTVLSDVFGVSGLLMLRALADGTAAPVEMAALARGRLKPKTEAIARALEGRTGDHHRFLLRVQLARLAELDTDITTLDGEIDRRMQPYQSAQELVASLPGFSKVNAARVIAEIGTDMSVFKSPAHLASWAGVCPANNESAGKRKSGAARKGNVYLKTALVEAAQVAAKKKGSYYRDKLRRLMARRGYKRAIVALAHKLLIAIYHVLKNGSVYEDLGEAYLDRLDQRRSTKHLVKRLEQLGYDVRLEARSA